VLVKEARTDMTTAAQGVTGFNPPSLFGMSTGAPYLHAGNARTLEEVFDCNSFAGHVNALSANFCATATPTIIRQLVSFLESIDEDATVIAPQGSLTYNPDLCPSTL